VLYYPKTRQPNACRAARIADAAEGDAAGAQQQQQRCARRERAGHPARCVQLDPGQCRSRREGATGRRDGQVHTRIQHQDAGQAAAGPPILLKPLCMHSRYLLTRARSGAPLRRGRRRRRPQHAARRADARPQARRRRRPPPGRRRQRRHAGRRWGRARDFGSSCGCSGGGGGRRAAGACRSQRGRSSHPRQAVSQQDAR
jgi:hypothetical protein